MNLADIKEFFAEKDISFVLEKGKITELWLDKETDDETNITSSVWFADGYLAPHPEGEDRGGYVPFIEIQHSDGQCSAYYQFDWGWVFP